MAADRDTYYLWFYPWTLFLVFLFLKLSNEIDWSWWWVTLPLSVTATGMFIATLFIRILIRVDKKIEDIKGFEDDIGKAAKEKEEDNG